MPRQLSCLLKFRCNSASNLKANLASIVDRPAVKPDCQYDFVNMTLIIDIILFDIFAGINEFLQTKINPLITFRIASSVSFFGLQLFSVLFTDSVINNQQTKTSTIKRKRILPLPSGHTIIFLYKKTYVNELILCSMAFYPLRCLQ